MEVRTTLIAVLVLLGFSGAAVWGVRHKPAPPAPPPPAEGEEAADSTGDPRSHGEAPPEISPNGPYPRIVVTNPTFTDNTMVIGEEYSHTFEIRNEGFAPLKLTKGMASCKCILGSIAQHEIPPGGTGEVTMKWKPSLPVGPYRQTAKIQTNDPEHKVVELQVNGLSVEKLELVPTPVKIMVNWMVGTVTENQDATFTGYIISRTEKSFKILSLESSDPRMKLESSPIPDDELETVTHGAKSGYMLKAQFSRDIPIGMFEYQMTVTTDVPSLREGEETMVMSATIGGQRVGPLTIFGPEWVEKEGTIYVGRVDPLVEKKLTVTLITRNLPEEGLKFLEVQSPECIKVDIEPDPKLPTKRYLLHLTFPPNIMSSSDIGHHRYIIKVKTNHPRAPELEFGVTFSI